MTSNYPKPVENQRNTIKFLTVLATNALKVVFRINAIFFMKPFISLAMLSRRFMALKMNGFACKGN